jgi:hypothetical protein
VGSQSGSISPLPVGQERAEGVPICYSVFGIIAAKGLYDKLTELNFCKNLGNQKRKCVNPTFHWGILTALLEYPNSGTIVGPKIPSVYAPGTHSDKNGSIQGKILNNWFGSLTAANQERH